MTVHQKMGMTLENKVFQKLNLYKNVLINHHSSWEKNHKDANDSLTLQIHFECQILTLVCKCNQVSITVIIGFEPRGLSCKMCKMFIIKVSKNRNDFTETSFLPKYQRNFFKDFCPGL